MLQSIIENKRYAFHQAFSTWEDAIKAACAPLVENGDILEEYADYIIANVHEFGPYIVIAPEICIPHAQEGRGVLRTAIGFMKVEEAVDFGPQADYQPHLFFVLASTDNELHLQNLSDLVTLLEDETIVNQLLAAKSVEDLATIEKGISE